MTESPSGRRAAPMPAQVYRLGAEPTDALSGLKVTDDWFDFLVAMLDEKVHFLGGGAHALAARGVPRATQDLDV